MWLASTLDDLVAVDRLLEPEAGQTVMAALEPLARPADAGDSRHGGQRTADALAELARRALEGGGCPRRVGSAPQLLVTVDLDTLGGPGGLGGSPPPRPASPPPPPATTSAVCRLTRPATTAPGT